MSVSDKKKLGAAPLSRPANSTAAPPRSLDLVRRHGNSHADVCSAKRKQEDGGSRPPTPHARGYLDGHDARDDRARDAHPSAALDVRQKRFRVIEKLCDDEVRPCVHLRGRSHARPGGTRTHRDEKQQQKNKRGGEGVVREAIRGASVRATTTTTTTTTTPQEPWNRAGAKPVPHSSEWLKNAAASQSPRAAATVNISKKHERALVQKPDTQPTSPPTHRALQGRAYPVA